MDPKYRNIFWHQGVKVFEESLLKTKPGRVKIDHLENDVTKALLNIFEHCDRKVLGAFLRLINIKQSPHAFEFDFQITENQTYQQTRNRVFLVIKTESTKTISASSYKKSISHPDACIYNDNTAILIEAKTQSPIIIEQNASHIKHFLETTTATPTITWEQISERFKLLKGNLKASDRFLVSQFCDFLDLIGIADFDGFSESDFKMLGSIGKITTEDYMDFKRIFVRKIEKFMEQLKGNIEPIINTKNFKSHIVKGKLKSPGAFSAFYFLDENTNTHINKYPNLNFIYSETGIHFSITGEIQSSFNWILNKIKEHPNKFSKIADKLKEFNFFIYYKLQFAPMNSFLWNLIPGFPKKMGTFQADEINSAIADINKNWEKLRTTIIYQMETKALKHDTDRYFNPKEISFAANKNSKPKFAIRIGKRYEPAQIEKLGKKIVPHFKKEIFKLKDLIDLLRP